MLIFIMKLFFSMFLVILMILISFFIMKKDLLNREMKTSYECGFMPKNQRKFPFSLQFFLISLIFLIFDIEIAILLPAGYICYLNYSFIYFLSILFFIILLVIGLLYEWENGALNWLK
uniref:NADH dehydrogenase subunit 3 n=1 Tax=Spelaeomysis bottazzii TaxID=2970448 RepID=UPI002176C645|nr:NADH dehydrogenase subunit 3 [Spelaeomysis bottazzii]UUL70727.1 NADH dehydrogenase subunit 3 [Spelaeomysis bottazzii]